MNSGASVFTVHLPDYKVDNEPGHKAIGKVVDNCLREHFLWQTVVVRGLSSGEHQMSVDELIEIIKRSGTDRYDPERVGDRYENIQGKYIDLFAFRRTITEQTQLFKDLSWGLYHGAIAIHGKPVRLDILTVYDASKLKAVVHQYEGRDDITRDGFVFREPDNKVGALKAIIRIV
jgi:hypothetical protein